MKHIFLMSAFAVLPAAAQTTPSWNQEIASVPVAKCTVQEVTSRMEFVGVAGAADIAKGQLPALDELDRLINKAPDPKRSVGEQLSQPDLVRFVELSQRIKVAQLGGYVESRRERDAKALQRLVQIADQEYRFSTSEFEGKDAILSDILHAMRQTAQEQNWPVEIVVPSASICSFRLAAKALADEALSKMDSATMSVSNATLERLATKYGMKSIDPDKLSAPDRDEFYRVRRDMAGPIAAYNYAQDLRNLAWLGEAMDMNYGAMKQDVIAGGGEIGQIGKTADRMLADGQISAQQQLGFRVISAINEKIPANAVTEWSKTTAQPK